MNTQEQETVAVRRPGTKNYPGLVSAILLSAFAAYGLYGCGESAPPSAAVAEPETAAPAAKPVVSADAYVPILEIPGKLPDDPSAQMAVIMLESAEVPSANDVNVPAYPGAQLMSAMRGMEMSSNGEKMTSWPALSMLSDDEIADVVAFYTDQLSQWRHTEMVGMHMFWNGDENSNPLDITGQFSLVSLAPIPDDDTIRTMWPEMRTRIDVRYEPASP